MSTPTPDPLLIIAGNGRYPFQLAAAAGLSALAVEAGRTLLVEPDRLRTLADEHKISLIGIKS